MAAQMVVFVHTPELDDSAETSKFRWNLLELSQMCCWVKKESIFYCLSKYKIQLVHSITTLT